MIAGFFCRRLPAPALRGLAGTVSGFLPSLIRFSLSICFVTRSFSNAAIDI